MAFNWEQNAFLGYMVENYQRERGNDIFGHPLNDNSFYEDEDTDDEEDDDPYMINWNH